MNDLIKWLHESTEEEIFNKINALEVVIKEIETEMIHRNLHLSKQ